MKNFNKIVINFIIYYFTNNFEIIVISKFQNNMKIFYNSDIYMLRTLMLLFTLAHVSHVFSLNTIYDHFFERAH